jgi:adenosylhomocysteine nucleosidase
MSAPEPGDVAIVTAIPEEFEAIAKVVSNGQRLRAGKGARGIFLRGRISGASVLLGMTGDGAVRAERGLSFLLREFPVSFLVGAGAAGALVPSLRAGDIVVSGRLVDESGDGPLPDASLVARAVTLGAKPATFIKVDRPFTSLKEKNIVNLRFGIEDSALAVADMESAAWARAAASRGVPFLILRAVSDTFEEELPGFLSSCLTPDGSVDRAAVARKLITHPAALPVLLRARERVREGAASIGLFLQRLLSEEP